MFDVCFITDSKYVLATLIAIKSLLINNSDNYFKVHVICSNLSDKEQIAIKDLKTKRADVSLINLELSFSEIKTEHPYVSGAALYKFYLPQIFNNIDKLLYLDVDILVQGNISDLFNTDLGDNYAAVVRDMNAVIKGQAEKLGLNNYFNSGVMLLNLKKMREDNITSRLIEYKKTTPNDNFMDQNALNKIFNDNVIYLSPKYNYLKSVEQNDKEDVVKFFNLTENELSEIAEKPSVLHITGGKKPWDTCAAPCFKEFYGYVLRLPNSSIKRNAVTKGLILIIKYRFKIFVQRILEFFFNIFISDSMYEQMLKNNNNSDFMKFEREYISIKIWGKYRKIYRYTRSAK